MTIPAFGLGTFRLQDDVVINSVKMALELGYRTIDTAQIYDNEAAVGQAIAESGIAREALFITTKIWIENLSKDTLHVCNCHPEKRRYPHPEQGPRSTHCNSTCYAQDISRSYTHS